MKEAIAALAEAGLDLVHAFDTAAVGIPELADPERRHGLLVANTRALWPRFRAALARDRELAASADPLDLYTERAIARAFPQERAWHGHVRYGGAYLPLQRLAVVAGFAYLAPTHLAIHPIYGPWFALRAVVAVAAPPPALPLPIAPPCRCEAACMYALACATASHDPRAWIAVRDACPVGRAHRYGDDQLLYHTTKDLDLLR